MRRNTKKWKTKDKKEEMKNPKMESEKWVKIYQNIKKHLCHMLNKSWVCINLIIIILASMFHPILKNIWKSLEFLETQFQNVITSWGKIAYINYSQCVCRRVWRLGCRNECHFRFFGEWLLKLLGPLKSNHMNCTGYGKCTQEIELPYWLFIYMFRVPYEASLRRYSKSP